MPAFKDELNEGADLGGRRLRADAAQDDDTVAAALVPAGHSIG